MVPRVRGLGWCCCCSAPFSSGQLVKRSPQSPYHHRRQFMKRLSPSPAYYCGQLIKRLIRSPACPKRQLVKACPGPAFLGGMNRSRYKYAIVRSHTRMGLASLSRLCSAAPLGFSSRRIKESQVNKGTAEPIVCTGFQSRIYKHSLHHCIQSLSIQP